jgi:hypothetical protein
MKRLPNHLQAVCCVLACFLLSPFLEEPGEFVGGGITRIVFQLADLAWAAFGVASVVSLLRARAGAAIAIAGCLLWSPLVLYVAARGVWGPTQVLSILALVATATLCLRAVVFPRASGGVGGARG